MKFTTSQNGLLLIQHCESLHDGDLKVINLQPKMDPIGIWTEGWGHAMVNPLTKGFIKGANNKSLAYKYSTIHTKADADLILSFDVKPIEIALNELNVVEKQGEFDGLVSFTYNLGIAALRKSTLLKRVELNMNADKITEAFVMWNKAGGIALDGLTYRRLSEAHLYNHGSLKFFN